MCVFLVVWLYQRWNSEQSASSAAHWCRTPSQRCKWSVLYCCCCYSRYHCLSVFLSQHFCPFILSVISFCFWMENVHLVYFYFFDTAYFQVAAEGLSVPHLMCRRTQGTFTTARRCCGIFSDSGTSYKTADLLTYLLTSGVLLSIVQRAAVWWLVCCTLILVLGRRRIKNIII